MLADYDGWLKLVKFSGIPSYIKPLSGVISTWLGVDYCCGGNDLEGRKCNEMKMISKYDYFSIKVCHPIKSPV